MLNRIKNKAQGKVGLSSDEREYVVIDTETTGLFKNDRIVEIGCIVFKNGEMLEEWSTLINPNRDLGPTHIHKITPSMVSIAPTFEEIANDLQRLLNGRIIVGHNASFDIRMLRQEFSRMNITIEFGAPFCTMMAARQLFPSGLDNLSEACKNVGIKIDNIHSALGDARMALHLFEHVSESLQAVSPAVCQYKLEVNPTPTVQRKIFERKTDDAIGRIRSFAKKVPFPTANQKEVAYLLLMNMAMDDLVISPEENIELNQWANELGISKSRLRELHIGYLDSFIQSALRDGIISEVETEVLTKISFALEIDLIIPNTPITISSEEPALKPGNKICFTGTAISPSGKQIHREDLEAMAARVGLSPVPSVTKKGCDILVAADEASMSGKAQKARDWGILVISVDKFITLCTFG